MGAVWNGWQTTWQGVVQHDDGTGNGDQNDDGGNWEGNA